MNILDDDKIIDLSELFKMFGDSTRVKIINVLLYKEMCVNDIYLSFMAILFFKRKKNFSLIETLLTINIFVNINKKSTKFFIAIKMIFLNITSTFKTNYTYDIF